MDIYKISRQISVLFLVFVIIFSSLFDSVLANDENHQKQFGHLGDFFKQEDFKGLWLNNRLENGTSGIFDFRANNPFGNRSSLGISGDFNNEIGIRNRFFYDSANLSGNLIQSGIDVNGDGKDNLLYGYGGKLFLVDLESGITIWETKILDIKDIVSVEDLYDNNQEKYILITFGSSPNLFGILDGSNGELIKSSGQYLEDYPDALVFGSDHLNNVIYYHDDYMYVLYRHGSSGSRVYGNKVYIDTDGEIQIEFFYNGHGTGNNVEKQGRIANINGKEYIPHHWRNNLRIYDMSTPSSDNNYRPVATLNHGLSGNNYSATNRQFTYDFNKDGNDEIVFYSPQQVHSSAGFQKSRIYISGTDNNGGLTTYFGKVQQLEGSEDEFRFHSSRVARNYSDLSNSHIFIRNQNDSYNRGVYKFNGSTSDQHKSSGTLSSTFNDNLVYTYDNSNGTIAGIFDTGEYHLVILSHNSRLYFYKYEGEGTFDELSDISVPSQYANIACDYDKKNIRTQNITGYYCGIDTKGNGLNEFITYTDGVYTFHEISTNVNGDLVLNEVKNIRRDNDITGTVRKRGFSDDLQKIWQVTQDSNNIIRVYYSEEKDGDMHEMNSMLGGEVYGGGKTTKDISIVKIGSPGQEKNYVIIDGDLYDFSELSPTKPPTLIKESFGNCYIIDVDPYLNDGNECILSGKTYTINSDFTLTEKYPSAGTQIDINGDGVRDFVSLSSHPIPDSYTRRGYRLVSGKTGADIQPPVMHATSSSNVHSGVTGGNYRFYDFNNNGTLDVFGPSVWRFESNNIFNVDDNSWFSQRILAAGNVYMYDLNGSGKQQIIGDTTWNQPRQIRLRNDELNGDGTITNLWQEDYSEPTQSHGYANMVMSINTDDEKTNIAIMSLNGRLISVNPSNGNPYFDNYYYNGGIYNIENRIPSTGLNELYTNLGVPLNFADVLLADFSGNGKNEILAGSNDGYVYLINPITGDIIMETNLGVAIKNIIYGDINNNGKLDIILSAEDGYIYNLTNSNLPEPSWVNDGPNYGYDIGTQVEYKKAQVNFARVQRATGYFVQLYNSTERSQVFDWVDVGDNLSACIRSADVQDENCISAGRTFNLNGLSRYEWRVQAYNDNVTSPSKNSNGFTVLRLEMDKKVALASASGDTWYDDITVSPGTIVKYRILIKNESLNIVGGPGYMDFDIMPAQPTTNCDNVIDCRTKNIIITDYLPTNFQYYSSIPTIWQVRRIRSNGEIEIITFNGVTQGDGYFTRQDGTNLSTDRGSTLTWEFPSNVYIPAGGELELIFHARANQ